MKIGFSLSRCVKDIIDGNVKFNDVLVIVSRTSFDVDDDSHWKNIWLGYGGDSLTAGPVYSHSNPEWAGYDGREAEFRNMCRKLRDAGKLHQPRLFGAHPGRMQNYWYDMVVTPSDLTTNPAALKAWENYQFIAGLTDKKVDFDDNF